jgi:hypothetical protein
MLAGAPPRIAEMTAGLTPDQLQTAPDPESWSANQVLAHLRACADMWGGAMTTIITEEEPTLRAINPRAWIKKTNYPDLDFETSLRSYAEQRGELVILLEVLPPAGWSRSATVTGAGKVLQRTALLYGQWIAGHERPHLKQIARIAEAMSGEPSTPQLF